MSDLSHAAAQILDRMREMTPEAAHVAGRVLQFQAIGKVIVWIAVFGIASSILRWAYVKTRESDVFWPLLAVMAVADLMLLCGALANAYVLAACFSPEMALAARIMEALPR